MGGNEDRGDREPVVVDVDGIQGIVAVTVAVAIKGLESWRWQRADSW